MDIASHLATPDVSLELHVKRCVVELGRELENRTAIYLDAKFWIILRDCISGRRSDDDASELLNRLRGLVAGGTAFCPISESTYFELLKQGDTNSRLQSARIVDELSLGVALLDHHARIGTEVVHFIRTAQGHSDLYPLHHLVWSRTGYILGFIHPHQTGFDPATELAIQKAFFDYMWHIPLEKTFGILGEHAPSDDLDLPVWKLNDGIARNADILRSFAQAHSAELAGAAELGADMAMPFVAGIIEKETGAKPPQTGSPEWKNAWNMWANLIFAALKKKPEIRQQLRTLYIHAALHAAFRWDKARRFTSNDLYDMQHASAALAYCRAFFTEHALRNTIAARHVALDKLFGCQVTSEISDAIEILKTLEKESPGACNAQDHD